MGVAKSGARGTLSLATLFAHGCGAAKPHHNHEKDLFGEAKPPQTPPEKRLCNRHGIYARSNGTRPRWSATATASARLCTPSLPKIWLICDLTVFSERLSRPAIALLLAPATSSRSTSSSRADSSSPRSLSD